MGVIDPGDIVDRDPESRRFEDLLAFGTAKRVLTVGDLSGRGKTTLLQKLKWECDWRHELPVALVALDEYDDHYGRAGELLIERSRELSVKVTDTKHLNGFSTGWGDYFDDNGWIVLFVAVLALTWVIIQIALNRPRM